MEVLEAISLDFRYYKYIFLFLSITLGDGLMMGVPIDGFDGGG